MLAALLASAELAHSQTIGGIPYQPLENISTTPRGDGSTLLGNIGSSGADGLRLEPGEVGGIRVDFDQAIQAIDLAGDGQFNVTTLGVMAPRWRKWPCSACRLRDISRSAQILPA